MNKLTVEQKAKAGIEEINSTTRHAITRANNIHGECAGLPVMEYCYLLEELISTITKEK